MLRADRLHSSIRLPRRATIVFLALGSASLAVICLTTAFGEYSISVWSVISTLFGHGSRVDNVVIRLFRLPRILECVLVGAALGLSGGVYQALTRNPLASPDIIGVNEGAAVVAVFMILRGSPADLVPIGAFGGAIAVVLIVGALGVRRQFSMYRLILVGIGISSFGGAIIAYLLTLPSSSANFYRLEVAQQWLVGAMSGASWHGVRVLGLALLIITPIVLALSRELDTFQLGDDLSTALGLRSTRLQIVLALLGALLAAVVVSVAGPIGFVAFISPHIARRLARTSSAAALPVAMVVGGLLVLLSDYAAQRIFEPTELPVGIMTVVLGAPYLLFLLYKTERRTGFA